MRGRAAPGYPPAVTRATPGIGAPWQETLPRRECWRDLSGVYCLIEHRKQVPLGCWLAHVRRLGQHGGPEIKLVVGARQHERHAQCAERLRHGCYHLTPQVDVEESH